MPSAQVAAHGSHLLELNRKCLADTHFRTVAYNILVKLYHVPAEHSVIYLQVIVLLVVFASQVFSVAFYTLLAGVASCIARRHGSTVL